jgi:FG-GAP repeat/Bacterial Ig-like domain (group 3)
VGLACRTSVVGVLMVLCLGCAPAVSTPAHLRGDRRAAGRGLASLPVTAWGPVGAALGRDDELYWVHRGAAVNPAQHLRFGFSAAGVSAKSGHGLVRISLAGFGRRGAVRSLGRVAPHAHANRVVYSRGALREWYANGPLGLEQGFDVARPPSIATGGLVFELSLSGALRPRIQAGAVLLPGDGATLRYTAPEARDALGRRLRSRLQLTNGRLVISVDDRGARYPVRVDPFLQQAELTASDGAAGDDLGFSVAVDGDTIVAGAPFHRVGADPAQGAVYVFVEHGDGWANATQTAALTASDGAARDNLGFSVAVSGDEIVAGAPSHQVGAVAGQGAVYVFVKPASGWANAAQTAELTASDGLASDGLGSAVAASANTVVAGAPFHTVGSDTAQGAAYVFEQPAGGWANAQQTAELTATDGGGDDELGSAVGVSGSTIVAGAPYHAGTGIGEGGAYVFVEPASGWTNATQTAELTASDTRSYDFLGFSVAVSGATVVAGAPYHQVGTQSDAGAAYVYVQPSAGWVNTTQTAELVASDGAASDYLGLSVGIDGDTVVAGAPYHQVAGRAWQGAAYAFIEPATGWVNASQAAELTAADGAASDYLGLSVAISGVTLVAGAPGHGVGTNPTQGAALTFGIPVPTSTSLSCTPRRAVVGQHVTCTAAAVATGGLKLDRGVVTFLADGNAIAGCGAVPVSASSGRATCPTKYPAPGSYRSTAVYAGTPNFAASASPGFVQIVTSSATLRGAPSGRSGLVTVRLGCAPRSGGCHVTNTLTTVAKPRRRVVGTRAVGIAAGRRATVQISLNRIGRELLVKFGRLPVILTISLSAGGQRTPVIVRTVIVRP